MTQLAEDRYAHLLQPIRDLAANWSVNIANELEEYLEVLEGVHFSFAEGGQSLNFAEAALLIQGSACIYSKKVEYLHSLVYQALEFIAERREKDGRSHKGGGTDVNGGLAEDADDEFEDEEHFLSLDDVLEEGTGIDLDEEAAGHIAAAIRPPATLLALEDTGNSLGDGDAGNYRIASCVVHRSGALLLEQRDGQDLDEHLQPACSEVGRQHQAPWAADAIQNASTELDLQDWVGDSIGPGFDDDDDDHFCGGDVIDGNWGQENPTAAANMEGFAAEAQCGTSIPHASLQQIEEEFDPYKPLDPNLRGDLKPRPFKRATKVARRPRANQHQLQQQQHWLHTTHALLTAQAPATGQLFPEFSYAISSQESVKPHSTQLLGSRATSQRSAQTATAFTYEEAIAGFDPADDDIDGAADCYDGGELGFDDDDDFAPPGDFALPDMAAVAATDAHSIDDRDCCTNPGDSDELTYEELCRAHIEAFIHAAAAAEVQTELASRVSGWRTKMAPMLEEEDARPEFDIHVYGDRILQRMAQLTCTDDVSPEAMKQGELEPLTFGQIIGVGPKYEASRSFSSMLQLINNGNVRITKLGGEQETFTLTLLDEVLPHKKVTDYRALGGAAVQAAKEKATAAALQEPCGFQENLNTEQAPNAKVPKKAKTSSGNGRRQRR